jgi:hypothetical protein
VGAVAAALAVGQVVSVDKRTEPGSNKLGGVARIVSVHTSPSLSYGVKYVLGGVEKGVEARYVHLHELASATGADDGVGGSQFRSKRRQQQQQQARRDGAPPIPPRQQQHSVQQHQCSLVSLGGANPASKTQKEQKTQKAQKGQKAAKAAFLEEAKLKPVAKVNAKPAAKLKAKLKAKPAAKVKHTTVARAKPGAKTKPSLPPKQSSFKTPPATSSSKKLPKQSSLKTPTGTSSSKRPWKRSPGLSKSPAWKKAKSKTSKTPPLKTKKKGAAAEDIFAFDE